MKGEIQPSLGPLLKSEGSENGEKVIHSELGALETLGLWLKSSELQHLSSYPEVFHSDQKS